MPVTEHAGLAGVGDSALLVAVAAVPLASSIEARRVAQTVSLGGERAVEGAPGVERRVEPEVWGLGGPGEDKVGIAAHDTRRVLDV